LKRIVPLELIMIRLKKAASKVIHTHFYVKTTIVERLYKKEIPAWVKKRILI